MPAISKMPILKQSIGLFFSAFLKMFASLSKGNIFQKISLFSRMHHDEIYYASYFAGLIKGISDFHMIPLIPFNIGQVPGTQKALSTSPWYGRHLGSLPDPVYKFIHYSI